ncbi:MAG: alpha/beta fold hydrolase, partial [Anaerolineae bacterium]|nr:alpha/beta fold hydrolase [Anaerolineae bacterium]
MLPETTRAYYPFKSHTLTLSDGYRMHYLDEGPPGGEVLLFLHGYPTWSFAYRAFLVYYAARGFRCIAVDHIGYGMSDKPTVRRYHTLRRHITNIQECIEALDLRDITLIMEDWGGPIGLGYAIHHADNVRRLVIMNSWVFQDTYTNRRQGLIRWATLPGVGEILFRSLNLAFSSIGFQRWTVRDLSATIMNGYKAPFRDPRQRTALVQFPRMINTTPTHPSAALMREIEDGLTTLKRIPTLIIWGEADPLFTPDVADHWKTLLPRAAGPVLLPQVGHIVSEDAPDAVVQHLDDLLDGTG